MRRARSILVSAALAAVTAAAWLVTGSPGQATQLELRTAGTCTIAWDGGAGTTNWLDAANWDADRTPGTSDVACIPGGSPGSEVAYSAALTTEIAGLDSHMPLVVAGGGLTVAGPAAAVKLSLTGGTVTFDGSTSLTELDQSGGELAGSGDVMVDGGARWAGGTESGSGDTLFAGGAQLVGAVKTLDGRALDLRGSSSWSGGDLVLRGGGVLSNREPGTLTIRTDADLTVDVGGGTFQNDAAIVKEAAAPKSRTDLFPLFMNFGSVSIEGDAVLGIFGGGSAATGGSFSFAPNAVLGFAGSGVFYTLAAGSMVTGVRGGSGHVAVAESAEVEVAGTFDVGLAVANGGTLTFAPSAPAPSIDYLQIAGGDVVFGRAAAIPDLDLHAGSLGGAGTVTVTKELYWRGGSQNGTGTTTVAAGGKLHLLAALDGSPQTLELADTRKLINAGRADWKTSTIDVAGGATLENKGSFTSETGSSITGPDDPHGGFVNRGLLVTRATGTKSVTTVETHFDNAGGGRVSVEGAAQLWLAGSGIQQGSFSVAADAFLVFAGAGTNILTGQVVSARGGSGGIGLAGKKEGAGSQTVDVRTALDVGLVDVQGGTLIVLASGCACAPGTIDYLKITGGDVRFGTPTTIPDLDLVAGSLGGAGTVTVTKAMYWRGGTQEGTGTTRIVGPGASLYARDAVDGSRNELRIEVGRRVAVAGGGKYVQTGGKLVLVAPTSVLAAEDRGMIDIRAGELSGVGAIDGRLELGGIVAPGLDGPGVLTVKGAYVQRATGKLLVDAGGDGPDRLDVSGTATLAGTVYVAAPEGFAVPSDGVRFVNAAGVSGRFGSVIVPPRTEVEYRADGVLLFPAQACDARQPLGAFADQTAPASPFAGPPALGEPLNLSRSADRSFYPKVARVPGGTGVLWLETGDFGGPRFRRVSDEGQPWPPWMLTFRGGRFGDWNVASSGRYVYVVWENIPDDGVWPDGSDSDVWLAASIDGGSTFGTPRRLSRSPGVSGYDARVAASGRHVSVVWAEHEPTGSLVVHAESDDAGETFPLQTYQLLGRGSPEAVAQSGLSSYVTWVGRDGIYVAHSETGNITTSTRLLAGTDKDSVEPLVAATGDDAYVVWKQLIPSGETDPRTGQAVYRGEIRIAASHDDGSSWTVTPVSGLTDGERFAEFHRIAADQGQVVIAWTGKPSFDAPNTMFVRRSTDHGASFGATTAVAPLGDDGWDTTVAVAGDRAYVTWSSNWGIVLAAKAARAETFELSGAGDFKLPPFGCGAQYSVFPQVAAGANVFGVTWNEYGFITDAFGNYRSYGNFEVGYRGGVLAPPDLELESARAVQAPYDTETLVGGKPTVVRVRLRSTIPRAVVAEIRLHYSWEGPKGKVDRTTTASVPLRVGEQQFFLPLGGDIRPAGRQLDFTVDIDPGNAIAESDETNDTKTGSQKVTDTRPFRVLFVPVVVDGEAAPTDAEAGAAARRVANGAYAALAAMFPVDPSELTVVTSPAPVRIAAGARLDDDGFTRLYLKLAGLRRGTWFDKVVGVVRHGWYRDHVADPKKQKWGASAPYDSDIAAVIAEAENTGGWSVAHELAHNEGWVKAGEPTDADGHQEVPASGYAVGVHEERKAADFMSAGATEDEVADPLARWIAGNTYEFLLGKLAVDPADPPTIDLTGIVGPDGSVETGPWYSLDGVVDTPLGSTGDLGLRFLGADGGVLGTAGFHPTREIAPLGAAGAELQARPFSVRVPDVPGTARIQITRGAEVLYERSRSAAAPAVSVTAPSAGVRIGPGDAIDVSWTSSDADGDPLSYLVALSIDDGASWIPLAEGVTGSSFSFAAPRRPIEHARIRVVATDGWNTTTAESGVFSIGAAPAAAARANISYDADGTIWVARPDGALQTRLHVENQSSGWGRNPANADWSPDGTKLVFESQNGFTPPRLWVMNDDGSGAHAITTGEAQDPAWSADGKRIAFVRRNDNGDREISVVNPDGTGEARLLTGTPGDASEWPLSPAWSPDGERIAYFRGAGAGERRLVIADADGPGERVLVSTLDDGTQSSDDELTAMTWAPDSSSIGYIRGSDFWTVALDGTQRRVTTDGSVVLEPDCGGLAWSPDGERIAYPFDGNVVVRRADGTGGVERLTRYPAGSPRACRPAWQPVERALPGDDGGTSTLVVTGFDSRFGLYTLRSDGTGRTPLAPGEQDANGIQGKLSPDGRFVVYSRFERQGIFVLDRSTGVSTRVTDGLDGSPSWSPDGTKIVFHRWFGGSKFDIYAVGADGSNPTRLTDDPADKRTPAWSPDGTRIAFTRCCPYDVWVMKADGTSAVNLTGGDGGLDPAWSPDGARIAFGDGPSNAGVVVMNADGSNPVLLDPEGRFPAWSRDGRRIAFEHAGTDALLVMSADGGTVTRLGWEDGRRPDWGPVDAVSGPPDDEVAPLAAEAGGPYTVDEGAGVALTASASGEGSDDAAFAWDLDDDGAYDDADGATASVAFPGPGSFVLGVQARGAAGVLATDWATVDVRNVGPTIEEATATIDERRAATLTAAVTDPGALDEYTATVDWGDGGAAAAASVVRRDDRAIVLASHGYAAGGLRSVTLTVTDRDGATATRTIELVHAPPNRAPVAEGQAAATYSNIPLPLTLVAHDPDNDAVELQIVRQPAHGTLVPLGVSARAPVQVEPNFLYTPDLRFVGSDSFTFTASDAIAGSAEVTVSLTVKRAPTDSDSEPPTTTAAAVPPPNAAGWNRTDVTVELTATDGEGGSGVKEIDYTLSGAETGTHAVNGAEATLQVAAEGVTTLRYYAVDNAGNVETEKSLTIRIDRTPPALGCAATPPTLWPPNHRLVPITVAIPIEDTLSGTAGFVLVSATSNEPDNGLGDGDTLNDIQDFMPGTADTAGRLRAERSGRGNGRVYSLVYEASDTAGNAARCTVRVTVPHNR